jgi:hypothetical protein
MKLRWRVTEAIIKVLLSGISEIPENRLLHYSMKCARVKKVLLLVANFE